MSQSPFGEGGFDLSSMLEQAQQMQQQLMDAQAELAATTVTGTAGGVTVTLDGTGELTGVLFAPDSVAVGDPEALTDLGDLVVAAFRDAKTKTDALAAEKLGPLTAGLGGPGGPMGSLGGPVV